MMMKPALPILETTVHTLPVELTVNQQPQPQPQPPPVQHPILHE